MIKVSPEAPIVRMINHLGLADKDRKVHTLTRQVLQACNVIRPQLENLKQNPRKSIEAQKYRKLLTQLQANRKEDYSATEFANLYSSE